MGVNSYKNSDGTIISYPKSGRTWLRRIFELSGVDIAASHAEMGLVNGPVGEHHSRISFSDPIRDSTKVIFLHRHPIDTAVSNFHQAHRRDVPKWSYRKRLFIRLARRYPPAEIDDFVLSPRYGVEKICCFNLGWIARLKSRPDTIVTSYERLSANTAGEIGRLLAFLRSDLVGNVDPDEIARQCSFDEMKTFERSGATDKSGYGAIDPSDPNAFKMRRGEIGGYRIELNPKTIKLAEEIIDRLSYKEEIKDFL
jgi:hypothetical protein